MNITNQIVASCNKFYAWPLCANGSNCVTFFSRGGRGGRGNRGGNRFQRGRGGRGRGGRGRGGSKVGMTAEELDNQLDMYMSKSSTTVRSHLDAELDAYMAESQSWTHRAEHEHHQMNLNTFNLSWIPDHLRRNTLNRIWTPSEHKHVELNMKNLRSINNHHWNRELNVQYALLTNLMTSVPNLFFLSEIFFTRRYFWWLVMELYSVVILIVSFLSVLQRGILVWIDCT